MRIINNILDRAVGGAEGKKGKGDIWVSLARSVSWCMSDWNI
jgi:hypothetical protein